MKKNKPEYFCQVCLKRYADFFASTKCCLDEPPKPKKIYNTSERDRREAAAIKTGVVACLYKLKDEIKK